MEQGLINSVFKEVSGSLNSIYRKRKVTAVFQKLVWGLSGLFFLFLLFNIISQYVPDWDNSILAFFRKFKATQDHPYANTYPFIGIMVLLYPAIYIFTAAFSKFKKKEIETMSKMVKTLFPKVEFTQSNAVPSKQIRKSKLFAWVKIGTPMYSYGQIRNSAASRIVNIADIGIMEQNASSKLLNALMNIPVLNLVVILYQYVLKNIFSGKAADNVYYTFRGMFCWLEYPKELKGYTVVLTNNQSSKIDRVASFKFKDEERIHLEDPRFTDQFIVYSTDQVEARYVLSIALMERIVALKEKFNQPVMIAFHNKQMFLTVESANGLFAFPSGKLDSIKIVEEIANTIETALKISEELKLSPNRNA